MPVLTKNGAILTSNGAILTISNSGSGTVNNQNKTVYPLSTQQSITADSDYTGLGTVTVKAVTHTATQPKIAYGQTLLIGDANNSSRILSLSGTFTQANTVSSGQTAAGADQILNGYSAWVDGSEIKGNIATKTSSNLTASGATVTVPAGYYASQAQKSVSTMTLPTSASSTATSGYTSKATISASSSVRYINIPPGYNSSGVYYTLSAASSGTTINNKPSQTIAPTESQQTIGYDSPYTGLEEVVIGAISSTYVGSGITSRSSTDLSASGATVTVPAGYYSAQATKSVTTMTLPTAATSSATSGYTSKATISRSTSDQYINIPPGYNSAGGYYKINAVVNGSVTAPATISGTSATLSTGTGTLTLTKTVSVTPSVTTAGYISSGTAGNSEISLTASVTINPTPTASGATVTIPAGYYSSQTTKSVSTMTLPTAASTTSSGSSKATIGRSTSNQYINIPVGYNSTAAYYTISAVANGSATGPSSLSGTSATVSTGTNTLTLTKTGVTTTPTVSAGYVSSATASTATVSLTASVTTKAAATYYPSTSDQTISANQYLTGAQTIKAVVVSGLDASKILSGTTITIGDSVNASRITSVSGNVSFVTYYTGSSVPSSSLGSNGDIYLQS